MIYYVDQRAPREGNGSKERPFRYISDAAKLAQPGGGSLTAFEKACDDAVTTYLTGARMVAFGEEPVVGYLYAKEAEMTAIRTIFAGRAAGLDGDTIRARLRMTYA